MRNFKKDFKPTKSIQPVSKVSKGQIKVLFDAVNKLRKILTAKDGELRRKLATLPDCDRMFRMSRRIAHSHRNYLNQIIRAKRNGEIKIMGMIPQFIPSNVLKPIFMINVRRGLGRVLTNRQRFDLLRQYGERKLA